MNNCTLYSILSIITFLFLQLPNTYSQADFLPGKIILAQGDTVTGYIDYRGWSRNPKKISFRKNKTAKKSKYSPVEVKKFFVKEEIYIGAVIKIETSPYKISELEFDSKLKTRFDTAFLQVVIEGSKSLYHYKTNIDRDFFYIQQPNSIELLGYKKYAKGSVGKERISEARNYISQLGKYLDDCSTLHTKVVKVKYQKSDLKKLFLSYSDCPNVEADYGYIKVKEKASFKFGLFSGLSSTQLYNNQNRHLNYLLGGVSLEITIPRSRKRISLGTEFIYSQYNTKADNFVDNITWNEQTNSNISYYLFTINGIARYKFPIGKMFLFSNIGVSAAQTNIRKAEYRLERTYFTGEVEIKESEYKARNIYKEFGVLGGLGLKYKGFSFEVRGTGTNGPIKKSLFSFDYKVYCLAGYQF